MIAGCSGAAPPPPPAAPTIDVRGLECVDHDRAIARLREALARRDASSSDMRIAVRAEPVAADPAVSLGTRVELTVERSDGTRGLERSYRLARADCASAPELLALALDRFLAEFPIWGVPARRREERSRALEVVGGVAAGAALGPSTPAFDLGGALDLEVAPRHMLGAGLTVRASAPLALGSGRYQLTTAAIGGRWRYTGLGAWEPRLEVRGGGVLVLGVGFDADNDRQVLPWFEGVAAVSRRWRGVAFGAWVAVAPVSHRAVTDDGLFSRDIPNVHAGLSAEWRFLEKQ